MGTNMLSFVMLIALSVNPPETILVDRFDIAELNHKIEADRRESFQQLIFYKWDNQLHKYRVQAWRMIKDENLIPQYNPHTKTFVHNFIDGNEIRTVHSKHMIETWTKFDPEVIARSDLPQEKRTDLTRRKH